MLCETIEVMTIDRICHNNDQKFQDDDEGSDGYRWMPESLLIVDVEIDDVLCCFGIIAMMLCWLLFDHNNLNIFQTKQLFFVGSYSYLVSFLFRN